METQVSNTSVEQENAIDFKALASRLWSKRKYVFCVGGAFVILGVLVACLQKPVYNSYCTFVPLSSSSKSSSAQLSSLAALAGINVSDISAGASLSPLVYPQILANAEFNKELMRVPLHFEGYDEPVSLYDMATDPQYQKFTIGTVIGAIRKYTIGLPGVIIGAIRSKQDDDADPVSDSDETGLKISSYTKEEYNVHRSISAMLSMTIDRKQGYLTLSAKAPEALLAAELCQSAMDLIQKYINEFKQSQVRDKLSYLQARSEETRNEYLAKQLELAQFLDSNRGELTATSQTRRQQLSSEYELAFALYTEVSKQQLQAELQVKNDTPVLSAVKPVDVPMHRSNSRSRTLAIWVFFGLIFSCGSVFAFDWLRTQGVKWPKNWE